MFCFVRAIGIAATLVWLAVASAGAQAQPYWIDINDAAELRALHTNKTHKVIAGSKAVAYYRGDGSALFVDGSVRTARTWVVRGNDQVCYSGQSYPGCRKFKRARTNPNDIQSIHEDGWDVLLKVEEGVPNF
jgi:hypothetical protein